jgi:hypothetical protein
VQNKWHILIKHNDIVAHCATYLRITRNARGTKESILYTDETSVHAHHTAKKHLATWHPSLGFGDLKYGMKTDLFMQEDGICSGCKSDMHIWVEIPRSHE